MEENRDKVPQEEYQVIQEKIVPKKKQGGMKRIGRGMFRSLAYGALFGVAAAVTLVFAGRFLIEKMGLDNLLRQMVAIGDTTPTPKLAPTKASTPTPELTVTKEPTDPTQPTLPGKQPTLEPTPELTVTIEGGSGENTTDGVLQKELLQELLGIYSGMTGLAQKLERSLLRITVITEGVDWFEEAYETRKSATGLYVGDNGIHMLFLVNLDSVEGATRFEAVFSDGTVLPATIYSYDTNYRLAVLAIKLTAAASMKAELLPEKAVFALKNVEAGVPVMILGSPNGHIGAMEFGMTTGVNQVVPVVDDEVMYFTTGITCYSGGDGFVFNLAGEVIGIVSESLNNGENGVFTAAMVSGMREIIDKTLNNQPRIYCGLLLETVDEQIRGNYNLPDGVYVREVRPSSPAISAGLKNGDIILQVGETAIDGVRQFYEVISAAGTGGSVRITVNRELQGEWKKLSLYMTPEERMH